MEVISLLLASAGASLGLWALQRHREHRLDIDTKLFEDSLDPDAAVVLGVAKHEASSRKHVSLWPLHLLYGLLQDETFIAAIERLGGKPQQLEDTVLAALDKAEHAHDIEANTELTYALGHAYATARSNERSITITDLFAYVCRTDVANLVTADTLTPRALLFVLVHGMPEPTTDLPDRADVHIVLRNDDYTTREFVVEILREIFELPEPDATTRMEQTHDEGRAIVARCKLPLARERIAAARARAAEHQFPLWIGVEDC